MNNLKSHNHLECKQCILTSQDYPQLELDENGICNICKINIELIAKNIFKAEQGKQKLNEMLLAIKKTKSKSEFNCIVGLSGGADSSYLALKTIEWGLKPLFLHVDGGWNSESAVFNIETLVRKLNLDYRTEVLNWPQMQSIQKAFIMADVLDIDLPFDNAFMSVLYKTAAKYGIKHIISGHNTATEGYMPPNFTHIKNDKINIKAIHNQFGKISIENFPTISRLQIFLYNKFYGINFYNCLDWMDYDKNSAKKELEVRVNWKDYGLKHAENIYTRFYQNYILPNKFLIDKRKSHFSMLILSGQISRTEALFEIKKPTYINELQLRKDMSFFIKKLDMSSCEMSNYINRPQISHNAYKSQESINKILIKLYGPVKPFVKNFK